MFDFAWSELALIAVISVVVLGPKQLPETMRTIAKVIRRVRSLGAEFQGHVNDMVREAELEELRQKIQKLSTTSVTAEVTKAIDPTGELTSAFQDHPHIEPDSPNASAPGFASEAVPQVAAAEAPAHVAAPNPDAPPATEPAALSHPEPAPQAQTPPGGSAAP